MKNITYKIFRPFGKEWREVSGDSETLATFLERYEIEIPCGCEFMRFENDLIRCWIYCKALVIKIKIFEIYAERATI